MIQFAAIKTAVASFLPWKKIGIGLLIIAGVGILASIFFYVRGAEENRHKVTALSKDVQDLKDANVALSAEYQNQIRVIQAAIYAEREREKTYADKIETVRKAPPSDCVSRSPAILESLRLRRERRAGG